MRVPTTTVPLLARRLFHRAALRPADSPGQPFVRVVADGRGCGYVGCRCSPANFVAVSDGGTVHGVELTTQQAHRLRLVGALHLIAQYFPGQPAHSISLTLTGLAPHVLAAWGQDRFVYALTAQQAQDLRVTSGRLLTAPIPAHARR